MNRRRFLQATLGAGGMAAFGGALAACSSAGDTPGTVTYWDYYVSQAPWVDNELSVFQKNNSGIKVAKTTQVGDKYADLLSLAFKSGNGPDVYLGPFTVPIPDQVRKNAWPLELNQWATPEWQSRFPPGAFVEGINVYDGKIYSAPFNGLGASSQLYIHNGIFRDAGLVNSDGSIKIPKSWDDMSAAAAAIKSRFGDGTYAMGFGNAQNTVLAWWMDNLTRGAGSPGGMLAGVNGMDLRVGRWTYDTDPNYAAAIELILKWKRNGYFYPNSMSIDDEQARFFFSQGKFAMTIGGVWCQPPWKDDGFTDYSLTALPSPTGTPKATFYGVRPGSSFFISRATKNPENAWKLLDSLYSVDAGKRWVAAGLGLSSFPQANDPAKVTFKPFADYVALSQKYALVGPLPRIKNPEVSKVVLRASKPDFNDILAGLYTGQLTDVKATLGDLAGRLNGGLDTAIQDAVGKGAKVSRDDYQFPDWDPTVPYAAR